MAVDERAAARISVSGVHDAPAAGSLVTALVQLAPRLGDVHANLERHHALIAEARAAGASLVVFPELSLTGYFLKDLVPECALRLDSDEVESLAERCADVDALVGCVLESEDTRFYNAALYLSRGTVAHVHRKVYLPTYGIFDEQRYLGAGSSFHTFEMRGRHLRAWRAGVLICEDMWHPSAAALLARQRVDMMLCPSASPGRGVGSGMALGTAQSYDAMTRTYAQLSTAYVVYCNRVGYEDGIGFWGGSRVVGPDGSPLAEPAGADEAIVYHRLERSALRRARIATPLLRDERHDVNDAENERIRRERPRD
ncbi:MAG TPA: nitrilase-related carbon-nitrogen hydrolase [Candidatus Dormibacteraeota bacterium]